MYIVFPPYKLAFKVGKMQTELGGAETKETK